MPLTNETLDTKVPFKVYRRIGGSSIVAINEIRSRFTELTLIIDARSVNNRVRFY